MLRARSSRARTFASMAGPRRSSRSRCKVKASAGCTPPRLLTRTMPPITEQGYKFVFRNFPTAGMILRDAFVDQKEVFASVGAAPKTAVFMHVNDTFGTAMKGGIGAVMPKFDMPYKIVETVAYDPAARDLSVEISKAKATGADALLMVSRLNDAILLTREMVKQRWTPMAIMSMGPGWYEDQYLKTPVSYTH